ncbi:MAG: nucleotidyltransferase domain-containing protein [Leptolyngbyaceae cyanobacterium RU_5_1]|nr:nucleotidyltransferase domain-containing protein [Leptolyngbyaceae cyanobacterium RU_5_1]
MLEVPSDKMQGYVATARQRKQRRSEVLRQRRERGLLAAHQAARVLKETFGAEKVVLFGSLLTEDFDEGSDIDLAVWRLSEAQYFQAVSTLLSLSEFTFDLVEIQCANSYLREAIAQGQEL